jgi:hypothetical protein
MPIDEERWGAALLIGGILTVVVTSGGYLFSQFMNPDYQFSMYEGFLLTLFVIFCYLVLFGYSYYLVGFWQETKRLVHPDRDGNQREKRETRRSRSGRPQNIYVIQENFIENDSIPEDYIEDGLIPESADFFDYTTLEDFGIRRPDPDDDWIIMKKAHRK